MAALNLDVPTVDIRKRIPQTVIRRLARQIAKQFKPQKIILFGSHAREMAAPDSDVDLVVVMNVEGSKRQKATEIDIALFGLDVPIDVIVMRPEELERNRNQIGSRRSCESERCVWHG